MLNVKILNKQLADHSKEGRELKYAESEMSASQGLLYMREKQRMEKCPREAKDKRKEKKGTLRLQREN